MKYIDVFPFSQTNDGLRFLLLRRASDNSYPGIWQPVAGKIKPGETAWEAGLREFREETGLVPLNFYVLDHVSIYYLHGSNELLQVPVFIAEVELIDPILSHEHDHFKWCDLDEGVAKASWEPYRVALRTIPSLLHSSAALKLAKIL
ncbi:MAG: NUDIX pyrophosphatase [Candidatus Marinimicrobia bacterium]|nr:NUDIX pyrophosphatase [Candidatus Neomarinimicrobiota bacterium]